jgi:hypothetical protein
VPLIASLAGTCSTVISALASAASVSMSTRWPPEVTTQRVAAYRHFEKPTPNGRSSAAVAASQPDS